MKPNGISTMKFVADCMLGKLAKWLRLIGFDTLYMREADDSELVRIALQQGRVLLTRDTELARRKILRGKSLLIEDDRISHQLSQVMLAFELQPSMFTRCAVCNGKIAHIDKAEVRELVPPYVFKTHEDFGRCSLCGRIYWRGTHVEHVLERLKSNQDPSANL